LRKKFYKVIILLFYYEKKNRVVIFKEIEYTNVLTNMYNDMKDYNYRYKNFKFLYHVSLKKLKQ